MLHVLHLILFIFTSRACQVLLRLFLLHQVTFTNFDPDSPDNPDCPDSPDHPTPTTQTSQTTQTTFGPGLVFYQFKPGSKLVQTWLYTSSKSVQTRFNTCAFLPRLVFVKQSFTCLEGFGNSSIQNCVEAPL